MNVGRGPIEGLRQVVVQLLQVAAWLRLILGVPSLWRFDSALYSVR